MANEIVTEIRLELDKFRKDLLDAQHETTTAAEKIGEQIGHQAERIKDVFLEVATVVVGAFTLDKAIEAASEEEEALNTLNASMLAAGTYTEGASAKFQDFAEELQNTTRYGKGVIETNAALLVSLGRLKGEGLEDATKAALDFAAGMHIDVETAFRVMSKAAEGNLSVLNRYGIFLRSTGDQAADFARVLDQVNGRFGGSAQAQVETYAGAIAQLKNNVHDTLAAFGDFIIKSPLIIGSIKAISEIFQEFNESLNAEGGGADVIGNWTRQLVDFGTTIVKYVIPPLELFYNIGKIVFDSITTGVQTLLLAFTEVALKLVEIGSLFSDKFNGMKATLQEAAETQSAVLVDMANQTSNAVEDIFDFGFTDKTQKFLDNTKAFVNSFGKELLELPKKVQAPFAVITKQMEQLRAAMQQIVMGGMVNIASGGIQRIGASLVVGAKAFGDFKNFALNALGDMSIKMGEAMITQSTAFIALAALISNPFTSAAASIAFGIALIALGGVLKAAAGSGAGGASAGAGGGGGGVAAGDAGLAPTASPATAAAVTQPGIGTHVVVNVQGNILDRRQTGLELAEVINESFQGNGVAFATGGR